KNQEPRTKNQKEDRAAKNDVGKGGDKPMPNGEGGKPEDAKDAAKDAEKNAEKKPGDGAGKDPQEKPTGAGAGENNDEPKPAEETKPEGGGTGQKKKDEPKTEGGGAGSRKKDEPKIAENGGGSGGDKPDDKRRDGGGGSMTVRRTERDRNGGAGMTAEQRRDMVANRAEQLAESGKTLQDVLNEIAKSTEPGDKEAVAKIQEVIQEIDINKLVTEMNQVANMIRSTKDDDAKLSSLDVAERLEIMAQRLDAAYRVIVAPQAEELRKLEQALVNLREQLEKLETPSQVAAWHREVREFLDQLDKLGVSPKDREYLEKEMAKAGFGLDVDRTKRAVNWGLVNGYYAYPVAYNHALIHLQEDIQERIQTLILGDLGN
ncbi:MAG TPA: hypothetical protein VK137_10985, partial [Planctomycetaceae bacterium]|nr:hypothetical protein [Planctomycetaceae bacterium]